MYFNNNFVGLVTNAKARIGIDNGKIVFNEGGLDFDFRAETDDNPNTFNLDGNFNTLTLGSVGENGAIFHIKVPTPGLGNDAQDSIMTWPVAGSNEGEDDESDGGQGNDENYNTGDGGIGSEASDNEFEAGFGGAGGSRNINLGDGGTGGQQLGDEEDGGDGGSGGSQTINLGAGGAGGASESGGGSPGSDGFFRIRKLSIMCNTLITINADRDRFSTVSRPIFS